MSSKIFASRLRSFITKRLTIILIVNGIILFVLSIILNTLEKSIGIWIGYVSNFIALFVAIFEIFESNVIKSKVDSYDETFNTKRNNSGEIVSWNIDSGTF